MTSDPRLRLADELSDISHRLKVIEDSAWFGLEREGESVGLLVARVGEIHEQLGALLDRYRAVVVDAMGER